MFSPPPFLTSLRCALLPAVMPPSIAPCAGCRAAAGVATYDVIVLLRLELPFEVSVPLLRSWKCWATR